jgi:hypothetical protein
MKIRSGFVSNSSSSSFVLFTSKENYDKVYKEFDALEKAVADYVSSNGGTFNGIPLIKLGYISGNYDSFEDWEPKFSKKDKDQLKKDWDIDDDDHFEDELSERLCEVRENIETKLKKSGDCIIHVEDF